MRDQGECLLSRLRKVRRGVCDRWRRGFVVREVVRWAIERERE